jgi:hypothetical protein
MRYLVHRSTCGFAALTNPKQRRTLTSCYAAVIVAIVRLDDVIKLSSVTNGLISAIDRLNDAAIHMRAAGWLDISKD